MIHYENNFLIYSLGSAFVLVFLAFFLASDLILLNSQNIDTSLSASVQERINQRVSSVGRVDSNQLRSLYTSTITGQVSESGVILILEKYDTSTGVFNVYGEVVSGNTGIFNFNSLPEGLFRVVSEDFIFEEIKIKNNDFLFLEI